MMKELRVVIGYGAYYKRPGFLNKMIRFGNISFGTAIFLICFIGYSIYGHRQKIYLIKEFIL